MEIDIEKMYHNWLMVFCGKDLETRWYAEQMIADGVSCREICLALCKMSEEDGDFSLGSTIVAKGYEHTEKQNKSIGGHLKHGNT